MHVWSGVPRIVYTQLPYNLFLILMNEFCAAIVYDFCSVIIVYVNTSQISRNSIRYVLTQDNTTEHNSHT